MILKRTVEPAAEPLSVSALKNHLRVDLSDDDELIAAYLEAARDYVEKTTRRSLVTQTWRLSLDGWPACDEIILPRPPLQSVTSIVYYDSEGASNTLASSAYDVDIDSEPGRVVLKHGESWPSTTLRPMNPVQVTYVAGYGLAADVPSYLVHLIRLLVSHWYENREPVVVGSIVGNIPLAVDSLIWLNRSY
ncbi:MAG: head-tail connector protein [Anaerolineae bacterium]|nr:head-tail connector protein [Anaerolineae bacterium]